jgi:hypothetical protein
MLLMALKENVGGKQRRQGNSASTKGTRPRGCSLNSKGVNPRHPKRDLCHARCFLESPTL